MIEFRMLNQEEWKEMLELACYAFNVDKTEDREHKFKKLCEVSNSFGAFSDETLIGQVLVRPMEVYIHGVTMPMGGVSYVSSYPEYRGNGNIAALLHKALEKMDDEGKVFSYLAPFSYPFYRKYGYEHVFDGRHYTIDVQELPHYQQSEGKVRRMEWKEAETILASLYDQKHRESVGPLHRKKVDWEFKVMYPGKQHIAVYFDGEDRPQGYLLYRFEQNGPGAFVSEEMVYLTGAAFKGLWNFIYSHRATFKTFRHEAGEDEKIAYLFENPRIQQTINPGMMARIVNMEKLLKQYPFRLNGTEEVYLKVQDETAAWNDGIWKLEMADGRRTVKKITEEKDIPSEKLAVGTIQTWTQLFLNDQTPKELCFHERLQGSQQAISLLESILPQGIPVLFDGF